MVLPRTRSCPAVSSSREARSFIGGDDFKSGQTRSRAFLPSSSSCRDQAPLHLVLQPSRQQCESRDPVMPKCSTDPAGREESVVACAIQVQGDLQVLRRGRHGGCESGSVQDCRAAHQRDGPSSQKKGEHATTLWSSSMCLLWATPVSPHIVLIDDTVLTATERAIDEYYSELLMGCRNVLVRESP